MLDLDELQRLAEGATPSDGWFVLKFSNGTDVRARHVTGASTWIAECRTDAEAAYIAALSPDTAKKLIAVARAAGDYCQSLTKALDLSESIDGGAFFAETDKTNAAFRALRTALEELK